MSSTAIKLIAIVALVLGAIVLAPLLVIWSINTLFPVVNIPYTLETWAASAILFSVFNARFNKKG